MGYQAPIVANVRGLFSSESELPDGPLRIGGVFPYWGVTHENASGHRTRFSPRCLASPADGVPILFEHGRIIATGFRGLEIRNDDRSFRFIAELPRSAATEYLEIASGRAGDLSVGLEYHDTYLDSCGVLNVRRASVGEISVCKTGAAAHPLAGVIAIPPGTPDEVAWLTLRSLPHDRYQGAPNPRISSKGSGRVDHEARTISGMVLAEAGPLKSRRGEFDLKGIEAVAELINDAGGVESYWTHDHVMDTNNVPILLGMVSNARVDRSAKPARVRADLAFFPSASGVPGLGDLAGYVMQRADERPQAISSSLVFYADLKHRPPVKRGRDYVQQPPLLRPTSVLSSDIVGEGDAVSSLLSKPARFAASYDPLAERRAAMKKRALSNRASLVRSY